MTFVKRLYPKITGEFRGRKKFREANVFEATG